MIKQLSAKLAANYIKDIFRIKFEKDPVLEPLVFAYYVTMGCNFRCSYCDYQLEGKTKNIKGELDTQDSLRLLRIIRKVCPNIYLTGGEPLLRKDIIDLLKECKRLNFKSISLVSNMSLIHQKMEVLDYVDNLTASLDMIDEEEYSKVVGVPKNIMSLVKKNIIRCAQLQQEKGFNMTINFVANERTIPHAKDVINFCIEHGIRFTLGPEVPGDGSVKKSLLKNKAYIDLIDYVIEKKKESKLLIDSSSYLLAIKSFNDFNCYPALTPRVEPNGDLYYPCKPLKDETFNLLSVGSYKKLMLLAAKKHGALPKCKGTCHMNCYLVPSNLVRKPLITIREYL